MVFSEPTQTKIDLTPSPEIAKNEARILWREQGYGGKEYGIIAVRNNNETGDIVHLPYMGRDMEKVLRSYGFTDISYQELPREKRELIIRATNILGPLLGVDAVLNGKETNFDKYRQPCNGMPEPIMGVIGEPGAGKTTFLVNIWAESLKYGYITVRDADPYSPTCLTEAIKSLHQTGIYVDAHGDPFVEPLFEQMQEFHQEASSHDWQKPQISLKEILSGWRKDYLGHGIKNPPINIRGKLINRITIVDLPGIKTDRHGNIIETRTPDAVDLLKFSMERMEAIRDFVNFSGSTIGPQDNELQLSDLKYLLKTSDAELSKCGNLFELNIREFIWAIAGQDVELDHGLCSQEDGLGMYWQTQKSKLIVNQ